MIVSFAKNLCTKSLIVKDLIWEELKKILSNVIVTSETMEEFDKMSSDEKTAIKDVGGYIGGEVKKGGKSKSFIVNRTIITLDADNNLPPDFIKRCIEKLHCKFLILPTHRSRPDKPRVRIILPMSKAIGIESYDKISRYVANLIGIDYFDDCSFLYSQMMLFSSVSKDYKFEVYESEYENFLDPDEILAKITDWDDMTKIPRTTKETASFENAKKNNELFDPAKKEGIEGAMCEAYTVSEGIDKYLSNTYKKSRIAGRYDYIKASSIGGVAIIEDKYAYSFHATDLLYRKCVNIFDLIRIALFGNLDDSVTEKTPLRKYPSYKKMCELVMQDKKVMEILEKRNTPEKGFDYVCVDWKEKLTRNPETTLINDTYDNILYILFNDENLKNIKYNILSNSIEGTCLPWKRVKVEWSIEDESQLKAYLAHFYREFSEKHVRNAILKLATDRFYDPFNDYLMTLPVWDGIKRIATLFIVFFGAEDNIYVREAAELLFKAVIARTKERIVKFDILTIIAGKQGIGKSTFFQKFAKKWFSDSLHLSDIKDKTGVEKLQGCIIMEASELVGLSRVDINQLKSFASSAVDRYRPPYAISAINCPRRCVIVGTTNQNTFLRDTTGNRRYNVIYATDNIKMHSWEITDDFVDQVWAEALVMYENDKKLTLSKEAEEIAFDTQIEALEHDDREGLVREYLDKLLPDDWYSYPVERRRNYFGNFMECNKENTKRRDYVSNVEIWTECFGKDPSNLDNAESRKITRLMQKITEWEDNDKSKRIEGYGKQRIYERKEIDIKNIDNLTNSNENAKEVFKDAEQK